MTETTSKPARKHPLPPLKLYEQIFCQHCQDHQYCNTNKQQAQNCILSLIADELTRTRQQLQHQQW